MPVIPGTVGFRLVVDDSIRKSAAVVDMGGIMLANMKHDRKTGVHPFRKPWAQDTEVISHGEETTTQAFRSYAHLSQAARKVALAFGNNLRPAGQHVIEIERSLSPKDIDKGGA
jgi:hypothetical protein